MKGAKAKNRPLSVESRRAKWRARHDLNVRSSESESDALSTRPRALTTSNYTADGEKRQVGIAAGGKFNLWLGVLAGLPGKNDATVRSSLGALCRKFNGSAEGNRP